MADAIGPFPSLSELMAWPTEHLTEAADHWTATGDRWYEAFTGMWQDSLSVDWQGDAAEKLQARTYADRAKVSGLADQLNEAATVARTGASELEAASSRVRYAVQDAQAAGFTSVKTSRSPTAQPAARRRNEPRRCGGSRPYSSTAPAASVNSTSRYSTT